MTLVINEREIEVAGLDAKTVRSIARRINRAAEDAAALGIEIFGGTGNGSLRKRIDDKGALILAEFRTNNWSGGDGADGVEDDGLMRGEADR